MEQQAIRDKSFTPSGAFVEFPIEDVETSIPARFEKIVRMYPDRLAVKMGDRALTYDELNRYANRVARAILGLRGVGSEPIGLFFEHGTDIVAAILGTLKAGKFYVALDPSSPKAKTNVILEDSQLKLIICNNRTWSDAEPFSDLAGMCLSIDEIDSSVADENLNFKIDPATLSSIVYTSGSTGTPKGVIDTHRNILESSRHLTQRVNLTAADRLTLLHNLTSASARTNLYLSLLNGASMFPFDVRSEGIEHFPEWLSRERITILYCPVALLRQLGESHTEEFMVPTLRVLHVSGAPITRNDFELYKKRFHDDVSLEISMGSTEARSIAAALVNKQFSFPTEGNPVGYAPPGKTILILDAAHKKLPRGEVGEIAVKGRNINPGYWRMPNLTIERYLADPDGGDEKIYLTGDLGVMLADGFLVHLGRKDLMVKIRGYRVNLNEVEEALLEHFQVKEAGVAAWDSDPGEKYLVGYVVPRQKSALNVSELNEFLRKKLSDYMIPASFVFLESLPFVNGKLDRTALPLPDHQRPNLRTPYIQPDSELQQKLSQIWAEVLSLDRVGVHDNFFDLGGHSLAATRLISRVLDSFRVEVSLKSLFESPTLAGFALRVEDALHQAHSGRFLPLIPVPRGSSLPASFAQRALWFHDQLEPGSCAYNLVSAYRLSGGIDIKALEQSVNQIIDRHEVLRTVFEAVDGQPVQTILPAMTIELPVIDLSFAASDPVRESEVRRIAGALAGQPFDLARGPLLRTALLRLANDEYILLLAIHHVVFDGWSMGIFLRELSQIYNNFVTGKPSPMPQLRIQYGDFAAWQRERLQGVNLENHLSYWKNQLERLPTLKLPSGRFQPTLDSHSGAREDFVLSKELSAELRRLSDRAGTTLFMVLLAAYKVALHRYTGQTDIAIGTPTAGRNHPGVEGLIGFFLNMLVLRADLSGNPTFRELLERIRKVCVDALAHQDLPFEKLVEELRPRRDLTHNPLIQVTFALQNTPRFPLNLTGVTARDLDISAGIARSFDLHLFMVEEVAGLRGYVSYNRNFFEADTIARLIRHLQNLLEGIVANRDQRISDLPMLTEPEKHQLLVEWNDTKADYPKDKCIHELFEEEVNKSPDSVALVFENQQLSYRELNHKANQLAHYLRKHGVGPDDPVGICMERSVEMAIGLLGILKAGGAYVPLDPSNPKERLGFMLEDTHACIVLTDMVALNSLPLTGARVSCLDRDWEEIAKEPQVNPNSRSTTDSLAYVIYTSGSTGLPKGVEVRHRGVVRLLFGVDYVQLDRAQTFLHLAPISFDAATFEVWGALLHGGKCVLYPGKVSSAKELGEVLKEHGVNTLWLTAALFNTAINEESQALSEVKQLLIGGEALSVPHVRKALALLPATEIINGYGPTESTTFTCCYRIPRELDDGLSSIPIGRPIGNTQVYILDPYLNPVPIGVTGDLHIGGDGLARGYFNRPELTAEKFIGNPFSNDGAARLYKTGDRARYLPDGNIEFIGRMDNQVKIRGFRIELGEIEAVLNQHPKVRDAVVIVREDCPGDKRLVAYLVGDENQELQADELKRFLKTRLPDYMVPSAWVKLASLPHTPNGKINRAALPAPEAGQLEAIEGFTAPRTQVEKMLAKIWAEVLKREGVGIRDNFFDLGGHSLLATQVISRLRNALNLEIPLRTLFESPTIEQMAAAIMENRGNQLGEEELERMLGEWESLSDEEAQRLLAEDAMSKSGGARHE
jgi:amino acid adenylation domain-containing protein